MIMLCSSVFVRATRHKLYSYISKNSLHTSAMSQAKVAVVLSGCGVYDGTEVHEASACLVHLSRAGAQVAFFAPDVNQMHVIDHLQGAPAEGETRSVRVESARIARGTVSALADLRTANFDAVVFPGGFGAAKNLSTFAVDGGSMKVNNDVERVIAEFRKEDKPIGLCCIAPVLAAKVLGDGVEVTIGNDAGTAAAIEGMGAKHCDRKVNESCVDVNKKVVTAPAYMYGDAKLHDIFDGIGAMIDNVLKLISK